MIELILKLLATDNFYNVGEYTDFAKGSHKIPMTFKEGINAVKRKKWLKK